MKKNEFILKAIHDTRKEFYNKATVQQAQTDDNAQIYFLKSYKSVVACVIDGLFYLNNKIKKDLLFSNTTLRHIKEFYKQFKKNIPLTKSELLKMDCLKDFDFLLVHSTNDGTSYSIATWNNYNIATSTDTKKFFKGFKGYKQRITSDANGKYLLTSSIYGYSNYRYYYI